MTFRIEVDPRSQLPQLNKELAALLPASVTKCYLEYYSTTAIEVTTQICDWVAGHVSPKPLVAFETWPDRIVVSHVEPYFTGSSGKSQISFLAESHCLYGDYVIICLPISGSFTVDMAKQGVNWCANSFRVFFGRSFASECHYRAEFVKSDQVWSSQLFDVNLPFLTYPSPFEIAKSAGIEITGLSLTPAALHFLDRSFNEKYSLDQKFMLLWTALEAQLAVRSERSSGERRIAHLQTLNLPSIVDAEVKSLFRKRNLYLKEGAFGTFLINDFMSLYLLFLTTTFGASELLKMILQDYYKHCLLKGDKT